MRTQVRSAVILRRESLIYSSTTARKGKTGKKKSMSQDFPCYKI